MTSARRSEPPSRTPPRGSRSPTTGLSATTSNVRAETRQSSGAVERRNRADRDQRARGGAPPRTRPARVRGAAGGRQPAQQPDELGLGEADAARGAAAGAHVQKDRRA